MVLLAPTGARALADDANLGLMIDAGLPDGLSGALAWRPSPRIRAHGGIGFNGFAPGVRAGVSVAAFPHWVTPTATIEAGHYFAGNANPLARMISGDAEYDEPMLRDVGYDYISASLGLELGYSGMTFYLHGGLSGVHMQLRNANESLASGEEESMGPRIELRSDPVLRAVTPSGRAGLVFYF